MINNKNKLCPICEKKTKFFFSKNKQPSKIWPSKNFLKFKKKTLNLNICFKCRHIFQYPMPNNKQIKEYYDEDQNNYTSLINNPELGENREIKKINFIKKIISNLPSKPSILEIGGFDGWLLMKLKKVARKILLIEPNKVGARIAKKNNINCLNKYFNSSLVKNKKIKFDIVVARNIIEHIPKINEFAQSVINATKKNGVIIIETPDQNTVVTKALQRAFVLQHLHCFSDFSLIKTFKNHKIIHQEIDSQDSLLIQALTNNKNLLFNNKRKFKVEKIKQYKKKISRFNEINNNKVKKLKLFLSKNEKKDVWIYGASQQITNLFTLYKLNKNTFKGIVDSDIKKTKFRIPACNHLRIYSIKTLNKLKNNPIVITSVAKFDITKTLNKYKHNGPRYFL